MYTIRPSKRKITFKENELIPDHMPQLPLRALFVGSSASGKTQALASMLRDEDFGSKQAWEQWKTGSNGKLGAMLGEEIGTCMAKWLGGRYEIKCSCLSPTCASAGLDQPLLSRQPAIPRNINRTKKMAGC